MYPQQQQPKNDMKATFDFGYVVMSGFVTCVSPFFRKDFGKEAFTFSGMVAMVVVIGWTSFANTPLMWAYFWFWLTLLLIHRLKGVQNRRNGYVVHSRYQGYPWLMLKLFPRIKDESNGRAAEGFVCVMLGLGLFQFDPAFAAFLFFCGVCVLLIEGFNAEFRKKRLQAMHDANIEQQDLARDYREGRF